MTAPGSLWDSLNKVRIATIYHWDVACRRRRHSSILALLPGHRDNHVPVMRGALQENVNVIHKHYHAPISNGRRRARAGEHVHLENASSQRPAASLNASVQSCP